MTLIDQCTSRSQGLGAVSYQMLSGMAHARLHGLSRLLMTGPAAQPGKVTVQMNIAADVLARQLLVGPLCATTLAEHLRWFLGWDTEKIDPAANWMDATLGTDRSCPLSEPKTPLTGPVTDPAPASSKA